MKFWGRKNEPCKLHPMKHREVSRCYTDTSTTHVRHLTQCWNTKLGNYFFEARTPLITPSRHLVILYSLHLFSLVVLSCMKVLMELNIIIVCIIPLFSLEIDNMEFGVSVMILNVFHNSVSAFRTIFMFFYFRSVSSWGK